MDTEREKIVQAATQLFAALGLDATTTEQIAGSAGMETAAVRHHFTSNVELYREVMRRTAEAEWEAVEDIVAGFTPTLQALDRLLDEYLDFYARNPDVVGLWQQRYIGDAGDTADLFERHSVPRIVSFANVLRDAVPDPAHLDYVLWTIRWVVMGFFAQGVVHANGRVEQREGRLALDSDLSKFREYLHYLARRLLDLPDERDAPAR
jgi:AcrR family transcriptional regulator